MKTVLIFCGTAFPNCIKKTFKNIKEMDDKSYSVTASVFIVEFELCYNCQKNIFCLGVFLSRGTTLNSAEKVLTILTNLDYAVVIPRYISRDLSVNNKTCCSICFVFCFCHNTFNMTYSLVSISYAIYFCLQDRCSVCTCVSTF